jgi:hypothetical protein
MRAASTDVSSHTVRREGWSTAPTSPYRSAEPGQRWLIQVDGGEFQLVESERELAELVRLGEVTEATPVYAVGDGPRALGEIPELARLMGQRRTAASSDPPVRRSPERAKLSEELAILNRPLDDEIEYYDEAPVRRWPRRVTFLIVLAAGVFGGYLFLAPRFSTLRSTGMTRLVLPARAWMASKVPATAAYPAVPSAGAPAKSVALAAPIIEPTPAGPPAPARDLPSAPPPRDNPPSATNATTLPAATIADGAPIGGLQAPAEVHRTTHASRRHPSRHHTLTRR